MAGTLPDPVDFSAGEVALGPYRLVRPISAGGMARVYEGRLDSLAGVTTRVAVKVIHPDYATEAAFQELFITEARISARLEHQNLVRIQQFNREGGLYYLVMEYIDGVTFRKIISSCRRRGITLPVQVIAELGRQVCEGLHYAHSLCTEHGEPLHLVHRDVKPSNLMLSTHGVVKVLDFGISSALGTAEMAGSVKGTWGYMALEQAEGLAVGPAADVFGLGAVLYELASREPLFVEKDNALIRNGLLDDTAAARAAALGGAYTDLGGVLVRALQRDPEARHRSAAAFGRALSGLVVDPVGVHDILVRLLREVREGDGPPSGQVQEKPRSMPTMSKAGLGSPRIVAPPTLPVRFGDKHGVRREPEGGASSARKLGATFAAAGLLLVALAVLGFAAWQLFFGKPRRVVDVPAPPAVSAPPSPSLGALVDDAPPVEPAVEPPATPAATSGAPLPDPSLPDPSLPDVPPVTPPAPVASTGRTRSSASAASGGASTPRASTSSGAQAGGDRSSPAAVVAEPDAPVRIAPPASTAVVPTPEVEPTPPPPTPVESASTASSDANAGRRAEGLLTVSSMPRAQVMIDGQYVRYTPIFQYAVAAGSHTILLVAEDGRRKSFRVEVPASGEARKIWLFDEEKWSDP